MNACTQMLNGGKSRERIWWLSGSQESDKVGGGLVSENNSASILKITEFFFQRSSFYRAPRGAELSTFDAAKSGAGVLRGQQVVF